VCYKGKDWLEGICIPGKTYGWIKEALSIKPEIGELASLAGFFGPEHKEGQP
jgi:hypothetical protein